MKHFKHQAMIFANKLYYFFFIILFLLMLTKCASSEKNMRVSQFNFDYKGESYVIRSSYCPDDPASCNELIGNNFIAVDFNQDRFMDKIIKGNIPLSEAQEIYDYCLGILERQNKLEEINRKLFEYFVKKTDFDYTITTFYGRSGSPFNEFKITDKRKPLTTQIYIFNDNNADGVLNDSIKGNFKIQEAQIEYERIIEKGLKENELLKSNDMVLVKIK